MSDHQSFQRFAALAAIISFPLALGSIVLSGMAMDFNMEASTNPALLLSVGADGANLLRWGMILDMFSYYLPLLPVALFLWRWLGSRSPNWVRFYTFCGVGYILIGAIGATILAATYPPLIRAYGQASASQQVVLETIFGTITDLVYGGLWNILEVLLAGVWFIGIGLLLRSERRVFSVVSIILGISALLDSLGFILGIEAVSSLGLNIYLVLAPIWTLWLGIDLLRKPVQIEAT
jgi:hypothetical protein